MYSYNCNQLFLPSILIPPPIYHVSCPVSTVQRVLVFPCHQVLPIPSCISYLTYFLPLPLNYTSKPKTRLVEKMWRFKERLNQGLLVLSSGRISCEGRGSGGRDTILHQAKEAMQVHDLPSALAKSQHSQRDYRTLFFVHGSLPAWNTARHREEQ